MKFAQILAGGIGSRMGNVGMPKQFLMLGEKPIIIHTVEKFVLNGSFDAIIVTCPGDWVSHTKDLFSKHPLVKDVIIIEGGSDRNDSLLQGLNYIDKHFPIDDKAMIVTHDAVRPFVSKKIIDENIAAMAEYDAVDTVIPAVDTIVRVDNGTQEIVEIPVRDAMYQGQTPQTFNVQKLQKTFNTIDDETKQLLSDSCKLMLLAGEKVGVVTGDVSNFKITTPFDMKMACALVEESVFCD